jgi:hypothetical protein
MDPSREVYWRKKLHPIRPGAEPVEFQLSQRFYGMVVISALTLAIGLIALAIFAGFGRPDLGLGFVGLLFVPEIAWFWLDYAVLRHRASAYLRERAESANDADPPG